MQSYFDALLTDIENELGRDLSPLMFRDPRGAFYIPHLAITTPLGTESVRAFRRPTWTFNKVLVIEKEDFVRALAVDGWGERNDCLLASCKGFSTRALRDLIDM